MSDNDNVITFPPPYQEPTETEICTAIIEDALAVLETALLIQASSLELLRTEIDRIKAAHGWTWKAGVPPPNSLFGDAVLFHKYVVRVVPRSADPGPEAG